jgi:hypothetical protein
VTLKTVNLSVRVSDKDAAFLAKLKVDGAITPSEKLRAILSSVRRREEGIGSYTESLDIFREMLAPALQELYQHENQQQLRSELLHVVAEWVPEAMAFLASALLTHDQQKENDCWIDVERGMALRVFSLLQAVLRMGVTKTCEGYDPKVIAKNISSVLELARVVSEQHEAEQTGSSQKRKKE